MSFNAGTAAVQSVHSFGLPQNAHGTVSNVMSTKTGAKSAVCIKIDNE